MITITYVRAGTTTNVIPETAHLRGTLRTVSPRGRRQALEGIERVVAGIAEAHGQAAVFIVEPGYPPTINDDAFAGFALEVATDVLGAANTGRMPTPVMGAEDFSYVLEQRPGALAFLGVCPPGVRPSEAHACHSNRMQLDEDAMQQGIAIHCAVAERSSPANLREIPAPEAVISRKLVVSSTAQGRLAQLVRAQPSHG